MKSVFVPLAMVLLAAQPPGSHAATPATDGARPALPNGVAPCESCHGAHGEGNAALNAPRLAAQPQAYLARQLASYADGRRSNPVMAPIAKALDEKLRDELGAYYAGLKAPGNAAAKPGEGAGRGRQLAIVGDHGRDIQACANCHGPEGIGEPPTYPYIAGQQRNYLLAALKAWRDGSRRTDPSGQMPAIAKRLSDEDMAALADYYAAAAAPQPDTFRVARRPPLPPPAAAPKGGQGSRAGKPGAGVGSEQGVPTTGGSQGPGGGGATREERRQ